MNVQRKSACDGCPFKRPMTALEISEVCEPGDKIEMLCHESGCLDGDGVLDYVCKGFQDNLKRIRSNP